MTTPEEALEQARAAAAEMRASGAYADPQATRSVAPSPQRPRLFEWALIDPDLRDVRSTRRFGAPITAVKLALLRFLDQYHVALIAEQTRFNIAVAQQLRELEERIEALEKRLGE